MKSKTEIEKMLEKAIEEQEKNKMIWGSSYKNITEVWLEDHTKIEILKWVLGDEK